MDYNYHTHTYRCHHASDTPEEYILRAIDNGIKYMGFSDHIPFVFPNGHNSGYRIDPSEAADYMEEITLLREKYRDKIEIKIGFEMEYYPEYFDEMLSVAKQYNAEYLLLGQHFIFNGEYDGIHPTVRPNEDINSLEEFTSNIVDAIKSGVFTYVAHPDIFNFTGDSNAYRQSIKRICQASKECNVPIEINFLGIRDRRHYPREKFWQTVGETDAPVTFGFDAHDKMSAYDGESLKVAKEMVQKHNLNYIGKPKIVLL